MAASTIPNPRAHTLFSRPSRVARQALLRLWHAWTAARVLRRVYKRCRTASRGRVPLRLRLTVQLLPLTIWTRDCAARRQRSAIAPLTLDAKAVRRAYDAARRASDDAAENTFLRSDQCAPLAEACVAVAFQRTLGVTLMKRETVTFGRFATAARAVREFAEFAEIDRYPGVLIALESERQAFCRAVEFREEIWRKAVALGPAVANRRDRALRRRLTAVHRPRLRRLRRQTSLLAGIDLGDRGITVRLIVMQESLRLLSRIESAFSREELRRCEQHIDDGHRDLIALVTRNLYQGAAT